MVPHTNMCFVFLVRISFNIYRDSILYIHIVYLWGLHNACFLYSDIYSSQEQNNAIIMCTEVIDILILYTLLMD